jgi:putative peptidoglycan lipid II flippase
VSEATANPPTGRAPEAARPRLPGYSSGRGAALVAAGILISRCLGLVREAALARYFGTSIAAAAFRAALRIPNFLQNLFGEGVLSASFIPVYARLLAEGRKDEADRVAGAVFGLLGVMVASLVALGLLATPVFIETIAPGFHGETRDLAIHLVRIAFPGTGFLVMSAWCLGVLNSHRRFFLSYVAPVAWNVIIIGTLFALGRRTEQEQLAVYVSFGAVAGSVAQFAVQLPTVGALLGRFRPSLSIASKPVRQVLRSFGPVVIGRGVVQLSAYVDMNYASRISARAFAVLGYAQMLYLLPISLFGMSVSAAELPEMSGELGTAEEVAAKLRARIDAGLERVAFFVVPSACAFLLVGDVVGAAVLQSGHFHAEDSRYLWYLLVGSAVGLVAATMGRLYSSAFYALKDTRTPLYFATARVVLTAVLAYWSAVMLPGEIGVPAELGAIGITATTGVAAWVEFLLLRRALGRRIGRTGVAGRRLFALWASGLVAGGVALGIKAALAQRFGPLPGVSGEWGGTYLEAPNVNRYVAGALAVLPFGAIYFGLTGLAKVPQSLAVWRRAARLLRVG